jgi:hypothetical protein
MRTEDKTKIQNSIFRAFISLVSLIIQIWWITLLAMRLNAYSTIIQTVTSITALLVTIIIFNKEGTPVEF